MERNFNEEVYNFIAACQHYKVRMILVGGSAVNFYGYKRHSADVDFWIDNSGKNIEHLLQAINSIGFKILDFPDKVKKGEQNVSIKISPELEIELITNFNPGKTFDEAYANSVEYISHGQKVLKWNIISYSDLISSKLRSQRPKDLLDIRELKRIRNKA